MPNALIFARDLLLRRTLHCLMQPPCSQVIDCSGRVRVAVSMPWFRLGVARVWHAVGSAARHGLTISLGMSTAHRLDQSFRRSAHISVALLVTVSTRVRLTYRARSGHGGPRRVPNAAARAPVPSDAYRARQQDRLRP